MYAVFSNLKKKDAVSPKMNKVDKVVGYVLV